MPNIITDQTMEIHIAVNEAKISSVVSGTSYNPDVYNDLMVNTIKAFNDALTIAINHGYTFTTTDDTIDDDDEEDTDTDDNN